MQSVFFLHISRLKKNITHQFYAGKTKKTADIAVMCQLLAFSVKRNRASAEMLRCPNQWRSDGNRWRRISLGLSISM